MSPSPIETLFQALQKAALPGVWSKGVALSREGGIIEDSRNGDEIVLRIHLPNRPVSPKVSLWPEDGDWYCDCGDRNDPCLHIVAAAVALRNGETKKGTPGAGPKPAAASFAAQLHYRFTRENGVLLIERWIVRGEDKREKLTSSLVSYVGGLDSGRISAPPVASTREDFALDALVSPLPRGQIPRSVMPNLLGALKDIPQVFFENTPIKTATQPVKLTVELVDDGPGFRLRTKESPGESMELFRNGAALSGSVLRPLVDPELTPDERSMLTPPGRFFAIKEAGTLTSDILPRLEARVNLEVKTSRLPQVLSIPPRVELRLEKSGEDRLSVIPTLVYGEPPIARIHGDQLETIDPKRVPARDRAAERELSRRIQQELHIQPGQVSQFDGDSAVDFVARSRKWNPSGPGLTEFTPAGPLSARLIASEQEFELYFEETGVTAGTPGKRRAEGAEVLRAWREGRAYVTLIGGGRAPLPRDWLEKYGPRLQALLALRGADHRPPAYALPEIADLADELGQSAHEGLRRLRSRLTELQDLPPLKLPLDLRAELRHYQEEGVRWLSLLRDSGMGALLADDMGLGKTLQALCAIQGRTLVICPTSVLAAWSGQIERFRPGLKVSLYHGTNRKLDPGADITLTSYGILRLDAETLQSQPWDTVVIDEAQMIKNPESQVAQAAHRLRATFRLALSGTPVENHLEDLWSQFRFLNPGLLGSRDSFQEQFAQAISRGDREAAQALRRKVRPFFLRRLKREVAPELPPRTETVLQCELSSSERELYDSLLAGARREVIEKLEEGGNVLAALELLLRLRQACCHPSLVPGQKAEQSAKTSLLLESLEESLDAGHRALVFSQWTSYLDLIEPELTKRAIRFSRLDGSTRNRDEVVQTFQRDDGPSVMLISLKAGGVGITLTAADHIYILDPWWNPAVEDQAADRAHRIGQENPVLVQRLVARDTVEDRILLLQEKKRQVADAVLGEASGAVSLSRQDLLDLLV